MNVLRLSRLTSIFPKPIRTLSLPRDCKFDHGPSFYIIPEIPPDSCKSLFTVDNVRKLISAPSSQQFPIHIDAETVFSEYSRSLIDFQLSLSNLSTALKDGENKIDGSSAITQLESILYPIEHGFQILRSIPSFTHDPVWNIIISRLFQKLKSSRRENLCLEPAIYQLIINPQTLPSNLTDSQKNMLEALSGECWLEGAELVMNASTPPHTRFGAASSSAQDQTKFDQLRQMKSNLMKEEEQFHTMVLASAMVSGPQTTRSRLSGRTTNLSEMDFISGKAGIPIAESDLAVSSPVWLPGVLGGMKDGGHTAGMKVDLASDEVVRCVLRHCSTPSLRETIWRMWVRRSSLLGFGGSDQQASNDARIQTIRRLRHGISKQLGCRDWLDAVWRSKHRRSVKSTEFLVSTVLEPLQVQLKDQGRKEYDRLTEWASMRLQLASSELAPWDIDFAIEQYNYESTKDQLDHQLPTDRPILDRVHSLLDQLACLFQLRLVPVNKPGDGGDDCGFPPVFRVEDTGGGGRMYGELQLDLFDKPNRPPLFGQAVSIPLYTASYSSDSDSSTSDQHSIMILLSNLPKNGPITHQDMLSLASAFGTCLQHLLTQAHHHHLMGPVPCLAQDMRHVVPDLCSSLMFHSILPSITKTFTDSTSHQGKDAYSSQSFMRPSDQIVALPLLRQLYEARFDLALWSETERSRNWDVLNAELWQAHLPYAKHADDQWPCSASHLFGPNAQAGLQYEWVWRRLVMADVLGALREHGWPNTKTTESQGVRDVLMLFRDIFICTKDRLPPIELFRLFRGRDPSVDILLQSMSEHVGSGSHVHFVHSITPHTPVSVLTR